MTKRPPADKEGTGIADQDVKTLEIGKFSICADVNEDGDLQIRVYPQDNNGAFWDAPISEMDVTKEEVDALNNQEE